MSGGTDFMSDTMATAGSGCQPVQSPPKVRSYHRWTPSEEQELLQAVEEHGRKSWDYLSQSPKYPLLSCRSATMLKNKFYKLLRAEQGTSAAAEERKTDEQHLETTRNRVTSLELRMTAKKSESSASQDSPLKKAKRDLTSAQEACHHQGAGALLTSPPPTTTTDASAHGGLAQMMSSPGITTTAAKVDDALAMLKEALAIQIDANKAVSMCIEARDSGRGDDDTVRAALHVASLAQEKAGQARRILTTARQEQAAMMVQNETADGTVDVNDFHFPQLDNGETKQAGAAFGFDTATEQIFSSSHFTALNDLMSSTPSTKGSGRRTTPCIDAALLDACNFMVDHEWPHMNEASVDKLWNEIQQHSLEGLACCKHHADMFAASGSLHGIDDLSMWDLANTCLPMDKNDACRWNNHDHEASHLHT